MVSEARVLKEGLRSQSSHQHMLRSDETAQIGGGDTAPSPMSYVLAGLGFCLHSVLARFAAIRGLKLDSVQTTIRGFSDLVGLYGDGNTTPGFGEIQYQISIRSSEPKEKIIALVRDFDAYCPVNGTLRRPVKTTPVLSLNGEELLF